MVDRDGGSGPRTEPDLDAAAAAAVEAASEARVDFDDPTSPAIVRERATELDLAASAAAAVAAIDSARKPEPEHFCHVEVICRDL